MKSITSGGVHRQLVKNNKMSDWQATPELRFVERDTQDGMFKILQQKWERQLDYETATHYKGEWEFEWRDVPLHEGEE